MTREELAKKIFNECEKENEPVTMEEALEMADMEIKAGNVKLSVGHTKSTDRKAPKRKEDKDKQTIIADIFKAMANFMVYDNLEVSNEERQIDFEFHNECYSITLTKHRKAK